MQLTLRTFLKYFKIYFGLFNSPKTLANHQRDPLGVHTLTNSHFPTWGKKIPLLFLLSPIFPKPLFSFQVLSCRKKLSFPSSITPLLFTHWPPSELELFRDSHLRISRRHLPVQFPCFILRTTTHTWDLFRVESGLEWPLDLS